MAPKCLMFWSWHRKACTPGTSSTLPAWLQRSRGGLGAGEGFGSRGHTSQLWVSPARHKANPGSRSRESDSVSFTLVYTNATRTLGGVAQNCPRLPVETEPGLSRAATESPVELTPAAPVLWTALWSAPCPPSFLPRQVPLS